MGCKKPPADTTTRKQKKPQKPSLPHKSKKSKSTKPNKEIKKKAQKQGNNSAAPAAAADGAEAAAGVLLSAAMPAARQLEFFLRSFERAAKMRFSPLELDSYTERYVVRLAEAVEQDAENLGDHVREAFGASWKEELCERKLVEGAVDAGSPALLVISTSALRSLELLRGLKMFTKECPPVKLFAKHLKVEEQVTLLKARVNIACGTPSRIKKLIDMEALSLSRLKLVMLDIERDTKSYTLFTLPQVSNEFWDLYKSHLDQKVRAGDTRICFYGAVSENDINKVLPSAE